MLQKVYLLVHSVKIKYHQIDILQGVIYDIIYNETF